MTASVSSAEGADGTGEGSPPSTSVPSPRPGEAEGLASGSSVGTGVVPGSAVGDGVGVVSPSPGAGVVCSVSPGAGVGAGVDVVSLGGVGWGDGVTPGVVDGFCVGTAEGVGGVTGVGDDVGVGVVTGAGVISWVGVGVSFSVVSTCVVGRVMGGRVGAGVVPSPSSPFMAERRTFWAGEMLVSRSSPPPYFRDRDAAWAAGAAIIWPAKIKLMARLYFIPIPPFQIF